MTRVLVCGGRDYQNAREMYRILDGYHTKYPVSCLIQGGARGADAIARTWAKLRGINCREFPADWDTHGKAAGPIRNQQMLDEGKPDVVIPFPGGPGTKKMIELAIANGVPIYWPAR